jgi:exocyst complex component 2
LNFQLKKIIKIILFIKFFEDKEATKQAAIAVYRLLGDFASVFQMLIKDCSSSSTSNSIEPLSSSTTMTISSEHLSKTLRLIIILNNFAYTRRFILPRLKTIFLNYSFRGMDRVYDETEIIYKRVDEQLLDTVQNEYLRSFLQRLESRMYAGRFDWATHLRVTSVKDYVKHIVLDLARVHAEVYSISSQLVFLVLSRILKTLVDELAKLYSNINQFSKAGSMQACLDLIALQECLGRCMENETSSKLKEIISQMPDAAEHIKSKALTDMLNVFLKQMQPYSIAFRDVLQQQSNVTN